MNEELAKVFPEPLVVDFAGEKVEILPVKVGKLPKLLRVVGPILNHISQGNIALAIIYDFEAVIETLSILSGVDKQLIDSAELDETMVLAEACISVNSDFFTHKVAPKLKELLSNLETTGVLQRPTGSTPSKN